MRRRDVLRVAAATGPAAVAGCTGSNGDDPLATTVTHVYVLNRRSEAHTFELSVEYDGERVVDRTREISGTTNDSRPTALTISDLPAESGAYRFRFQVGDGEVLRTTPTEMNVREEGADCVRVTFVVNLDDRVTAYARQPCAEA